MKMCGNTPKYGLKFPPVLINCTLLSIRKRASQKSARSFPTKCFLGTNLNIISVANMCNKFSLKMLHKTKENFRHIL